ncbi:MAG TPA: hypothetical protein VF011_08470 [Terriglobales bacterium]
MTAKAWYWTGLGVMVLSIGSSGMGRCWMGKASGVIDQFRAKAVPYVAMVEMAMGHTESGLGHMQAAKARVEEQEARLQAAQARIDAQRARLQAVAAKREFRQMNVLADYPVVKDFDIEVPGVSVSPNRIVVQGRHGVVVCPRTRVTVPDIEVAAPHISVMQDPI